MEKQLQSKVAGVMIPYWDWTNPGSIMTNTFMGPDGTTGGRVQQGYFAVNRPGTGPNTTTSPIWWPPSLDGWTLSDIFPTNARGGLKRSTGAAADTPLPSPADLQQALSKANYPAFQGALEAGAGIASGHRLHNDMHKWIGGHMQILQASPFDPFFYLVHANVDRLWAMWQTDGHMNEYPNAGGFQHHRRNDLMYPWTGGAAGYGTNAAIAGSVPMPSWVTGPGYQNECGYPRFPKRIRLYLRYHSHNGDRAGPYRQHGRTYPDPMVVTDRDVTKWEAAKRGVSAFLQDAETAQASGEIYLTAGIRTMSHQNGHEHGKIESTPQDDGELEIFSRLLNVSVGVVKSS